VEISERRQRAVDLYAEGLSTAAVGERLGCSRMTIARDLRATGVDIRGTIEPQTEPRICARDGCENVFRPTPRQLRSGYGKFCSRACDHEAHRIHPKPKERVCARPGCVNRFTPLGANVALGWGTYCSKRCSALSTYERGKRKGRMVACDFCGEETWRYDSQLKPSGLHFCDHSCWGKYRWKTGTAISGDVVSLARGRSRQVWHGRWNAHKGKAGGIEGGREGGRPPVATKDQAAECWRLHREGQSLRRIAEAVFGDSRYFKRVQRIIAP
jgi:hypothetical protein